ncbi:MAG: glycerophosphodiester phosphodiesterase [Nitrospiraceae bacterium]
MNILRIGHRGAAGHAPENTLAAIHKAIALRCDLVEVDVRRTRDERLILLHDEWVDRTTNGKGPIAQMSLKSVRQLNAGGGERIPMLEEALQTANHRIGLILELKTTDMGQETIALVRRSRFRGPLLYASFLAEDMRIVRAAEPQAATMTLLDDLPHDPVAQVLNSKATHAGLRFDTATTPLVEALHAAGVQVFVYTVNAHADIRRVRSLGVDGIISDFPDRI